MLSAMKTIEKGWRKWELALLLFGGAASLAVMALTTADVIARNCANSSIPGAMELVSLLLLPAFTCALPYIQARRGQIILEFATEHAPSGVKKWLDLFGMGIGIFLFVSIAPKCWTLMVQAFSRGDITSGVVSFPIGPFRLILTVVAVSMVARLALDMLITLFTPTEERAGKGGAA